MSKLPLDYLLHILDECEYLTSDTYQQLSLERFQSDETLKRATARSLEIIGDAKKTYPIVSGQTIQICHGKIWP